MVLEARTLSELMRASVSQAVLALRVTCLCASPWSFIVVHAQLITRSPCVKWCMCV